MVVPLVLVFILAAADAGLWVFERNQAASSAHDGARVGILRYQQADVAGSSASVAIGDAGRRRLGTRVVTVEVRCVSGTSTVALAGGCAGASVILPDRIRVAVSWSRSSPILASEPFGFTRMVSGVAVLSLTGLPTSVEPP